MTLEEFVGEIAKRRSTGKAVFEVAAKEAFKESCLGLACRV
jgi:hypothetical protein